MKMYSDPSYGYKEGISMTQTSNIQHVCEKHGAPCGTTTIGYCDSCHFNPSSIKVVSAQQETAKDILDRHAKLRGYASYEDMILLGNPFYIKEVVESALPEIADKAFEAGRSHEHAAHFGSVPNVHPDKSTYMKQLFPDKI